MRIAVLKFTTCIQFCLNDKHIENNAQQIKGPDSQFVLLLFAFFSRPFRFMANALTLIIIIGGGVHRFF